MNFIKRYKLTIFSIAGILVAVLMPGSSVPQAGIPGLDKMVHFGMFGILTLCFYFEYHKGNKRMPDYVWTLSVLAGFGLLTEVMQVFAEARSFDLKDLAADVLGVVAISVLFRVWRNKVGL